MTRTQIQSEILQDADLAAFVGEKRLHKLPANELAALIEEHKNRPHGDAPLGNRVPDVLLPMLGSGPNSEVMAGDTFTITLTSHEKGRYSIP